MNILKRHGSSLDVEHKESGMNSNDRNLYWAFGLVAGSWIICLGISGIIWLMGTRVNDRPQYKPEKIESLKKFNSESEFRAYLEKHPSLYDYYSNVLFQEDRVKTFNGPAELPVPSSLDERVSTTNVQVIGIDEPDIVKTDGKHIFISQEYSQIYSKRRPIEPVLDSSPPVSQGQTQVIDAMPVEMLTKIASIDTQGELLVVGSRLLVLQPNKIMGYDISHPDQPKEMWNYTLADNRRMISARLVRNSVILVTQLPVYSSIPCPLPVFSTDSIAPAVRCTDVWHPTTPTQTDSTYTVLRLNPESGSIENQVSFVGSSSQSIVYASTNALYVTFTSVQNPTKLHADFLLNSNLINDSTKQRIKDTLSLSISDAAKQVEIEQILNEYIFTLSDDERMKWETERSNQFTRYVEAHKRIIETTVVSKIKFDDFTVAATGEVPGHPLNQFSLDEFQDHLRIATTVGGRGVGGGASSANDVYILNTSLEKVGQVLDLGKEERIYAVRFMGDKGYVVTFRETDPLYVLNLSNPVSPLVTGELKIPGYSSYLHPLKDSLLVGIGKEDNKVKVSLFDVADATQPKEVDMYILEDYWSSILSTHHAFLQDPKHEIFFVPSEQGGYIFSYADNGLKLIKTVEGSGINRAVYIQDSLYLLGTNKLWVLDEKTWATVKTFEW